MSHLVVALRRAAARGLGRGEVDFLAEDFVHYTVGLRPAMPVREAALDDLPSRTSPVNRPGLQDTGVELHTHLPPEVVSQLANLAQALDAHPAKPRTVAFVASGRGEGTTTCVANMATYLVNRRARV